MAQARDRIVLLGYAGLLGTDCRDALAPLGDLVLLEQWDLDITQGAKVRSVLSQIRPQAVVNCAAYTDVDGCEINRELAHLVNAQGPGNLARVTSDLGAYLVHFSTDYVFDGQREIPEGYGEEDPPNPQSAYGVSKWEGEQLVRENNPNHLIVRTAWLYGRHGKSFPKAILAQALAGRSLRVVADQYGSPTWSRTLAHQIRVLMERRVRGTVHAASHGHCNWFQFAKRILELCGMRVDVSPCSSSEFPRPARRPSNSILKKARLQKLGLDRMRPWEEDLAEFLEMFGEELCSELREAG